MSVLIIVGDIIAKSQYKLLQQGARARIHEVPAAHALRRNRGGQEPEVSHHVLIVISTY